MWMMGYNEPPHHEADYMMESNYATNATRKLRPLVPRPPPPTCASSSNHHRFHHDHNPLLSPLSHHHHHHHHLVTSEQNKREFNPQQMVVVSSRWNPTPEQLQTLEELYRRGTRTPSAEEIQHITAQLRRYGKIEGKNVFYWFQNHKARERQKRRRQLDNINPLPAPAPAAAKQPPSYLDNINLDQRKDSAEVEETRNWAIPTFTEKSSMVRERPRKADQEWVPVEQQQEELQQQQEEEGRNDQLLLLHRRRKSFPATWNHLMQSLSSPSSSPTNNHITLINSFAPKTSPSVVVSSQRHHHDQHDVESYETLELFPINSSNGREQPEKCFVQTTSDVNLNPRQFIEFLPLKK